MKRTRPHWPLLVRTSSAPEGDVDPTLTRIEIALIDEYRAQGESAGYDPYNASGPANRPPARPIPQRPRR